MELDPKKRDEALRDLIASSTVEAFEGNEAIRIACCIPACGAPVAGGCPLCEIVTVLPNGIVSREIRGH